MPAHSRRPALLVLLLISFLNGAITLVLLLIAPLGLAAVITLTLLIMFSTFLTGLGGGMLQRWLEFTERKEGLPGDSSSVVLRLKPATRRLPKR